MFLASSQKRAALKSSGEERKYKVNIKGEEIKEMKNTQY